MSLIKLENVNLHYSSLAYRETSLKAFIFKMLRFQKSDTLADIHALKDVNLELRSGDRLGLIGHNGAGKSTLLKTIAGLYPISSGKRTVQGQIRPLFELSLGFESEATGRENILYRGLLLGKSPREIRALEKEIVEFADIGEFIDYPIKTYSAGMLVRLAFSVSTAIPGDILLLDEVIGAGDADFMVKAKKRINELVENAEILVLASHDVSVLKSLCNRLLIISHGQVVFDGDVNQGIRFYQEKICSPVNPMGNP